MDAADEFQAHPDRPGRAALVIGASSQTAWAMMSLVAVSDRKYTPHLRRGMEYLCGMQDLEGTWEETAYTATGFPGYGVGARTNLSDPNLKVKLQQGAELSRGFMLSFNLYRHYFPIIALARCKNSVIQHESGERVQ